MLLEDAAVVHSAVGDNLLSVSGLSSSWGLPLSVLSGLKSFDVLVPVWVVQDS